MVNSDAGFGGPFSRSPARLSPPYCTGTSSGRMNLRLKWQEQLGLRLVISVDFASQVRAM
jgi:hypothetical protein